MSAVGSSEANGPVASQYYLQTEAAFQALIWVSVEAGMLVRAAREFGRELSTAPNLGELLYVNPPRPDDTPELRALIESRRTAIKPEHARVWRSADHYYRSESKFRKAVGDANIAVERAAGELDSPTTPPLRRTSIAIKRALRNLSGSALYPMSGGWAEPSRPEAIERVVQLMRPLEVWIEELRLLVQPPHSVPPTGGPSSPAQPTGISGEAKPASELPLVDRELDVLQALCELNALDEDSRVTANAIAKKATGDEEPDRVKREIANLARLECVASKEGRGGGSWITERGQAWLVTKRPSVVEALRNSDHSSATVS